MTEPNDRKPSTGIVGDPINGFDTSKARLTMFSISNMRKRVVTPNKTQIRYGTTWQENQKRIYAGKTVRFWKVKFSGWTDNIEEFIKRIQECRISSDLSEKDT